MFRFKNPMLKILLFFLFLIKIQNYAYAVEEFTFIVGSDPQPWRLDKHGSDPDYDPNNPGNSREWKGVVEPTYQSMRSLGAKFVIVNGDMTEFGRKLMWDDTIEAYEKVGIPILYGLGNHDYGNNVNDCADGVSTYFNNCASNSVLKLWDRYLYPGQKSNFGGLTGLNIVNSDYKYVAPTHLAPYELSGSFAYSFEYGGVHFIQLNYCPTYKVELLNGADGNYNIHVYDAITWLKNDISEAQKTGKRIILNYHAANMSSDTNKYCPRSEVLDDIIKKHVDFAFTGHTHAANTQPAPHKNGSCWEYIECELGVPHLTSGALETGAYFLVKINGDGMMVTPYNGETGSAIALKSPEPRFMKWWRSKNDNSVVITHPANGSIIGVGNQYTIITGTGLSGASISLRTLQDRDPFCVTDVDSSGNWICNNKLTFTTGVHTLIATQNHGPQSEQSLAVTFNGVIKPNR